MRVAFDVGPLRPEGAGVAMYVGSLATALAGVMPRDELAYIGHRPDAPAMAAGFRTLDRSARLPYPAWVETLAARDAKRAGADVVHYTDGLVPPIRHGRTIVTVLDLSIVRHWRAHRARRYPRIPLVLAAPHLADLVIVPSRATADEVMRLARVPAAKIEVIPLAARPGLAPAGDAEIERVLPGLGLRRRRYIVALGTIEPRKNHLALVRAFERLRADGHIDDDIELVIAGKPGWGHEPVLRAIAGSPATSRIRVLGYVPDRDLPALLTGAAVAAYVSLYEGFGLPVLEAMACGVPVVTSACSSMPEVAGDEAFLVGPDDPADIARGLGDAIGLPADARAAMGYRLIRQARRLDWATTARATAALYRHLGG